MTQTIRKQLPKSKAVTGLADKHGQRYAVDMELVALVDTQKLPEQIWAFKALKLSASLSV